MDTLPKIRAAFQNPKATIDELTAAAAGARAVASEAESVVSAMMAQRPDKLLTSEPKEIARFDETMATGRTTAESALALADACEKRAADFREEAAEKRRHERYTDAQVLVAALPAAVEKEYIELVRLGRSIVERIGRAREAARLANADLPKGLQTLPDVENFRRVPDQPQRVVSARIVKLYVDEAGRPIPDQSRVRPRWSVDGKGRPLADKSTVQKHAADFGFAGEYERDRYGSAAANPKTEIHVRRWSFVEYETVAAISHRHVGSFAHELKIPPLFDLQPHGWGLDALTSVDRVLTELEKPRTPIATPPANPPVFSQVTLDRFERDFGPLSELKVRLEDSTEAAARRQTNNPYNNYQPVPNVRQVSAHHDGSGPRGTWL